VKPLNRILALAPDCHTPPNYSHLAWRRHIYEGLRRHVQLLILPEELDYSWARQGHGLDLSPFEDQKRRNSEQLWARIKKAHADHGLDAVFTYCFASDLHLDVVRDTIKLGVPWINFFCDSTHMFEKVEPLARVVSLNWFPESAAEPRYKTLNVPSLLAPYAWNPDWLPDLTNRQDVRPAAFIGLPTANRITQLGWLRVRGCELEIRGHGWVGGEKTPFYSPTPARKRLLKALFSASLAEKVQRRLLWPLVRPLAKGPLKDEDFGEYVRESLVVLGLNQAPDLQGRLTSYLKFRDMEFPGYGCCYLTEHNPDIPRVFEVGKDILTFQNIGQGAEHLRRLRRDPEEARAIGRAGRRRILAEHNWGVRLVQLAQRL
jgi:hypothetical protein